MNILQVASFAGRRVTLYGWPHEKKNTFIFSGYVYHDSPWETLEHYVSLTNETANIATAMVEMALGIWLVHLLSLCMRHDRKCRYCRLCISTLSYWEALEETARMQLLVASICYMVATVSCFLAACVARAHHLACSA